MQDSSELWTNQPTLFSSQCAVAEGRFFPHVHPDEANGVYSCDNPLREHIVTCSDPEIEAFLQETGGLALDVALSSSFGNIPTYIPIFDRSTANFSEAASSFSTVGITLTDIVSGATRNVAGSEQELEGGKISFKLATLLQGSFRGKNTLLFLSGSDTLIEWIWHEREECQLFDNLRTMGFSAVTGFNFSLIEEECAFSQALNQKRSLHSSRLLEANSIPTIPHVYAINTYQIERVIEWFNNNPQMNIFTMNCQLQKTEKDVNKTIAALIKIFQGVRRPIHVILQGFQLDRIHEFGLYLDRIHFAEKAPIKAAQMGRETTLDIDNPSLGFRQLRTKTNIEELAIRNIMRRRIYIELVKAKVLKRYIIPSDILLEMKKLAMV